MNRRFPLAPSEGWLTVGLVAVLCVTMAAAIDDVAPILARDDFTDLLVPMAILGMLAGLIGAKVGWGRWLTYLVGAVFAALIVPLAVGDLLVRNAPVPVENAGTLAAAYHETATSLVKAATDLLVLRSPSTNQFGHFILVMGLLRKRPRRGFADAFFEERHGRGEGGEGYVRLRDAAARWALSAGKCRSSCL